jgi:hypothetical protein
VTTPSWTQLFFLFRLQAECNDQIESCEENQRVPTMFQSSLMNANLCLMKGNHSLGKIATFSMLTI